jgi:hypothetical protein
VVQRPALHAVAALATSAATVAKDRTRPRPTLRRGAAVAARAASAGPAEVSSRAGREPVRPCGTRLPIEARRRIRRR